MPSTCRSFPGSRQQFIINHVSAHSPICWIPDPADPYFQMQPGRFRAEIHERLVTPLYPLAFVMCAFAFLGQARSTREGRSAAATAAVAAVGVLRLLGFAATGLTVRSAAFAPLIYLLPLFTIVLGYLVGHRPPRSGRGRIAGPHRQRRLRPARPADSPLESLRERG